MSGHRPRRRIYWLSIPLDYGLQGQTTTGTWRQMLDAVIGRDKDTESSLSALPRACGADGRHVAERVFRQTGWGRADLVALELLRQPRVWPHPLPNQPHDPHARLPAAAFTPVYFDPSAAHLRGRRWRAARTDAEVFVRTYRDADDEIPDAYQAFIALHEFPDSGIAWPKATIFKQLDDLTRPDTTLDWTIHTTFKNVDAAVSTAQNTMANIEDQYRQRGRHAMTDDELVRKLASGKELISELKRGTAERGVNASVVIAAAAADAQTLNTPSSR